MQGKAEVRRDVSEKSNKSEYSSFQNTSGITTPATVTHIMTASYFVPQSSFVTSLKKLAENETFKLALKRLYT